MNFYNKHYIGTGTQGRIISGFSDAFEAPQDGDICINEQGGYQFRLFPNGEENPPLTDMAGAHLWRWENGVVRVATLDELEAERAELAAAHPAPPPDPRDLAITQLMREVAALKAKEGEHIG